MDEAALKHLTLLFHRIALPRLPVLLSGTHFYSTEFANTKAQLVDSGILFEPDKNSTPLPDHSGTADLLLRDSDEIIKPIVGLNTKEFIAARKDEKKFSEIKNKTDEFKKNLGQADPQTFFEGGRQA